MKWMQLYVLPFLPPHPNSIDKLFSCSSSESEYVTGMGQARTMNGICETSSHTDICADDINTKTVLIQDIGSSPV
jgi:hypothetical protein